MKTSANTRRQRSFATPGGGASGLNFILGSSPTTRIRTSRLRIAAKRLVSFGVNHEARRMVVGERFLQDAECVVCLTRARRAKDEDMAQKQALGEGKLRCFGFRVGTLEGLLAPACTDPAELLILSGVKLVRRGPVPPEGPCSCLAS